MIACRVRTCYMTKSYLGAPMTIKTTLSFTDRHHTYLIAKVQEGVFASASSAVASAIEQMMEDEAARAAALEAMAHEIRSRIDTPSADYVTADDAFGAARSMLRDG